MATALDVAEWMRDELNRTGALSQEAAVYEIESQFGRQFVYENENGNLAIDRDVLKEFRNLTEDDAVWERGEKCGENVKTMMNQDGNKVDIQWIKPLADRIYVLSDAVSCLDQCKTVAQPPEMFCV